MVQQIVNAASMTIMLGVQDDSTKPLVPVPEVLPTHLPKIYTYAQTGPSTPQLVVGDSMTQMYGADSFDYRKPYATHATALINTVNKKGNSMMLQRVVPADAPPPANGRLWLDVLGPIQVPNYQRNIDGSIKTDTSGNPVQVVGQAATVLGYKIKWVVTHIDPEQDGSTGFAKGTIQPGDQTDVASSTQSQRYPFMDFEYPFQAAIGDLVGVRVFAPTEQSATPLNTTSLTVDGVYPFRLQMLQKSAPNATAAIVPTQSASQSIDFCLKPGTISSISQDEFHITKLFPRSYQLLNDPSGMPNQYGPIGKFAVYQSLVDTLLGEFFAAEKPFIGQFSDFVSTDTDAVNMYRLNPFSAVSSQNVPYTAIIMDTADTNVQRMSEASSFYLSGGGDGTMNLTSFAQLVSADVVSYADPLSPYLDDAMYPESCVYDTGFPLQTKYDLISIIAIRKDTAVFLTPYDALGQPLTADEESSLAVALKTRLQQYPESDYFGTSTMRGAIIGRSGDLTGSKYDSPLPLTIELGNKLAGYMGAGNGQWKPGGGFDIWPANQVELFSNVNVTFTPSTVRNKDWANGLVWVEQFSRRALYFPAFKTVYDNDTSVLTSIITMLGCVELEKVGQRARRAFSGNTQLTNAQLVSRVNQFVKDNTNQRFDGRFVIVPDCYFTAADLARGFSWSLNIKLYANNMKTVQTLQISAYRMEDLPAATSVVTG